MLSWRWVDAKKRWQELGLPLRLVAVLGLHAIIGRVGPYLRHVARKLLLIAPTHGGMARLSWPGWLVTYRDCLRAHNPQTVTHPTTKLLSGQHMTRVELATCLSQVRYQILTQENLHAVWVLPAVYNKIFFVVMYLTWRSEMTDNSIQIRRDLEMFLYQLRIEAEVHVEEMVWLF